VWKPFVHFKTNPKPTRSDKLAKEQIIKLDRLFYEEEATRKDNFEIKCRCISVSLLCLLAGLFILTQADLSKNTDITVLRWFGLSINIDVLVACLRVLLLNSILFAGEIFQLKK
jgi:hypothetical protein